MKQDYILDEGEEKRMQKKSFPCRRFLIKTDSSSDLLVFRHFFTNIFLETNVTRLENIHLSSKQSVLICCCILCAIVLLILVVASIGSFSVLPHIEPPDFVTNLKIF